MELLLVVIAVYGALWAAPPDWIPPDARPAIALGVGMLLSAVDHVINENFYEQIMHDALPAKRTIIRISVVVRLLSGLGLFFPATRRAAAIACFVLFCVVAPVNLRVALAGGQIAGLDLPVWRRWARVLLHLGWLAWSFWCLRTAATSN